MLPPLGTPMVGQIAHAEQIKRERRTIFVDTRDANTESAQQGVFNLATVQRRGETFQL